MTDHSWPYLAAWLLLLVASQAWSTPSPSPSPRVYTQRLEVAYASPEDAARATMTFAPVYDNRDWAFSARWDDSNPNSLVMREHMAKYGLRGTFYLTQTEASGQGGADFAHQLMRAGCSVGGHSQTHPDFRKQKPGEIWWEILANRIEREDQTDTPINSFAFPYGQYKNPEDPLLLEVTTEAVRRAGYLHCVYLDFVRNNPYLNPGELCGGLQVVPGDKVVDAPAFQASLDKIFLYRDAYAKSSRCIFLGVHAWQNGAEWDKLDAIFAQLGGKPEWWYCNQSEWAAYFRQLACSTLQADPAETAATRHYTLTRPEPAEIGVGVPLTCVISGAGVRAVRLAGEALPCGPRGDVVVLNLPAGADHVVPDKIGHVEVSAGAQEHAPELQCPDFPGLEFLLLPDPAGQKLTLTCAAPVTASVRNLSIKFRLPLQYQPGVVTREVDSLEPGMSQTIEIPLPAPRPASVWSEGPQYWVAEIDFTTANGPGRVYVTRLMK